MTILPPVPNKQAVKALSFGDEQFYFRHLAYQLQNAGDSFGRSTPLKDYDYTTLKEWFFLLDSLDSTSHFIPALASYYYGQTQKTEDVRLVIDYLEQHARNDLTHKWWWLYQAIYLANHRLKDSQLALALAYQLADVTTDIPMWARQMPALLHEQLGEKEEALRFISNIADSYKDMDEKDLLYIQYFIKDRLGFLQESDILPDDSHN